MMVECTQLGYLIVMFIYLYYEILSLPIGFLSFSLSICYFIDGKRWGVGANQANVMLWCQLNWHLGAYGKNIYKSSTKNQREREKSKQNLYSCCCWNSFEMIINLFPTKQHELRGSLLFYNTNQDNNNKQIVHPTILFPSKLNVSQIAVSQKEENIL